MRTICAICGDPVPQYIRSCAQAHADVCCWCFERNLRGSLDHQAHPAPPPPRVLPTLTPREQQAVAAYQRHVQAVCGTGPLVDLVTEDTP